MPPPEPTRQPANQPANPQPIIHPATQSVNHPSNFTSSLVFPRSRFPQLVPCAIRSHFWIPTPWPVARCILPQKIRAMDDLLAFASATCPQQPDTEGADEGRSETSFGVASSVAGETPTKKQKVSSSGTAKTKARSVAWPGSPGDSPGTEKEDRPCLGCARSRESKCFLIPTETVAWSFPSGRGAWCKDCFCVWRTNYGDKLSQTMMVPYLKDPENLHNFRLRLVAHLSMRREGAEKISAGAVEDRVCAFNFLAGIFKIPLRPSVLVPLTEWHAHSSLRGVAAGSDAQPLLTTLRTVEGDKVAVWVPCAATQADTLMLYPGSEHNPSMVQVLRVTSKEDQLLAAKLFGDAGAVPPDAGDSSSGDGLAVVPFTGRMPDPKSKLELKFAGSRANALETLGQLSKDGWSEVVKESALTVPLNKLLGIQSEALATGLEHMLERISEFSTGVQAVKNFLKAYREFAKGHFKHEKVPTLCPHAANMHMFLVSQKIVPAPTLTMIVGKATFYQTVLACTGVRFVSGPFRALLNMGLVQAFVAHIARPSSAPSQQTSPDAWLRSVLFWGIQKMIESMEGNQSDEHIEQVAGDMSCVLKTLQEQWPASQCQNLDISACVQDVKHIAAIAAASCTPLVYRQLRSIMPSPRCPRAAWDPSKQCSPTTMRGSP